MLPLLWLCVTLQGYIIVRQRTTFCMLQPGGGGGGGAGRDLPYPAEMRFVQYYNLFT